MPDQPEAPACLALHGLGGGPYEVGPLIDALQSIGVKVESPVLPGHEGPGPKMPPSLWTDWASTAESEFDKLTDEHDSISVLGFSTGATLALYLASKRPAVSLVLLAPFLAIRYCGLIPLRPSTYISQIARVLPDLPRRPPAVRDPKMRAWANSQEIYQTFSLEATVSALELIETVTPLVPNIKAPALILQGKLDTVVEPQNATWLYNNLGSSEKQLILFPASDHLLALDRERNDVIRASLDFIRKSTGSIA